MNPAFRGIVLKPDLSGAALEPEDSVRRESRRFPVGANHLLTMGNDTGFNGSGTVSVLDETNVGDPGRLQDIFEFAGRIIFAPGTDEPR